ncbi:unnamed protein product, partial [Allacma fusca]
LLTYLGYTINHRILRKTPRV